MRYVSPTLEEAKEKAIRAFRRGADYLFADSRRDQWIFDACEVLVKKGLLNEAEIIRSEEQQYMQYRWRPTEKMLLLVKG